MENKNKSKFKLGFKLNEKKIISGLNNNDKANIK